MTSYQSRLKPPKREEGPISLLAMVIIIALVAFSVKFAYEVRSLESTCQQSLAAVGE